ncbi:MAG: sulfite oxidase heme-binding subunit YedZ [Acetobacteraceae bacterium]
MRMPWRDRHGRFIAIKAAVLALVILPALYILYRIAIGDLGPRPWNELVHATGLWAVRFVVIALAVTPAARVLEWNRLLLVRRMVGLTAMTYALAHFTLYLADVKFALWFAATEIALRFYLTIGFVALLGLVALGVTSTDAAVRRMGASWKRLHRLAYPIGALALWHYFIQTKANVSEPVYVTGLFVWLMLWRAAPETWRRRLVFFPLLSLVAGLATAGIEVGWYAAATRIDPARIWVANQTLDFGLRPAHWALVTGLAVSVLIAVRWVWRGRSSGARTRARAQRGAQA